MRATPAGPRHPTTSTDPAAAGEPAAAERGPGDTGTLRRSRPPRPDGGDPSLRPPTPQPPVAPPPPAPPAAQAPVPPSSAASSGPVIPADPGTPPPGQPVRRPLPPTLSSPGQPPPGVARRDGRHARPEQRGDEHHTPPNGYRPRHAAPDAETEQFAAVGSVVAQAGAVGVADGPVMRSVTDLDARGAGHPDPVTESAPFPALPASVPLSARAGVGEADPFDDPADRVRVVLAERRSPTRAVRTVAEIEAQTETGELLLGNLLRAQLTLAVRLGLVAVLLLGSLPVLFLVLPALGSVTIVGIRVPWLLVGFAPYPFLVLLGWLYIRAAERNELDFADNVED